MPTASPSDHTAPHSLERTATASAHRRHAIWLAVVSFAISPRAAARANHRTGAVRAVRELKIQCPVSRTSSSATAASTRGNSRCNKRCVVMVRSRPCITVDRARRWVVSFVRLTGSLHAGRQDLNTAETTSELGLAHEGLMDGGEHYAAQRHMLAPMPAMQHLADARFEAFAPAQDKQSARSRSAVMARHLQMGGVDAEMERLRADEREMNARVQLERNAAALREMHQRERWAHGFQAPRLAPSANTWANEFSEQSTHHSQWANEFSRQGPLPGIHPQPHANQWANEFASRSGARWGEEFQAMRENTWAQEFSNQQQRGHAMDEVAIQTAKQSSELAATLIADPKFANSNFAKLMSKMGTGEVVVNNDGLQETGALQIQRAELWAREFAEEQRHQSRWADEFAQRMNIQQNESAWAQEYANVHGAQRQSNVDDWAEEFKRVPNEWAAEFEDLQRQNPEWMENVWDQVQNSSLATRGKYRFTDPNPYLGRHALQETATQLAKDGVLSEAVLAVEAWVRENPQNSDAWYQLGRIQAENDDDQQAIAAMSKAHEVNPQNTDVLLALAVSHANELDQDEALGHARGWLLSQPRFQHIAGVRNSQTPEQMLELFKEAARLAPNDADVQTVLGVMAHLTRNYDEAINAFERATVLRPEDHSLWNKIGATRANGAESSEAIGAYRRALDLKPNYVRAWSNMGIGYANQGRYAESIPYYIRALSMNPNPDSPNWGYVRISLGCTGRLDLMHHCDSQNIEALRAEFPL